MYLIYFDESKFQIKYHPYFFLGGILIDESHCHQLEKTITQIQYNFFQKHTLGHDTELHGAEVFSGKKNFKGRKIPERIQLFKDVLTALEKNCVAVRMIKVDVPRHREKYTYPTPEYRLSLMLFLERCCDLLDKKKASAVVYGDYEQDEVANAVLDFSQFKQTGTHMHFGRSLGRLVDSIYFTHSHYSRFMQVADMVCFLCQRYESDRSYQKWHDQQLEQAWTEFKGKVDWQMQTWP